MRERFFSAFEEVLAANKSGEVKNLLMLCSRVNC